MCIRDSQSDTRGANYFRYPDGVANWKEVYPDGYRPISIGQNLDCLLYTSRCV